MSSLDRGVYFAALLSTATSSIWLIAPAAYHRMLFRYDEKQHMIFLANRMAIAGVAFLGLSITGVLFLITDVLFGGVATTAVTVLAAALIGGLWFVLPLTRRGDERDFRVDL